MNYPDSIDDIRGSRAVGDGGDYEIVIEPDPASSSSDIALSLYIMTHNDHKDIVPDGAGDCELYDNPTDPTTVSELPSKYRQAFESAVSELESRYGYTPQRLGGNLGVCTSCIPPDHMLVVTGFFEK